MKAPTSTATPTSPSPCAGRGPAPLRCSKYKTHPSTRGAKATRRIPHHARAPKNLTIAALTRHISRWLAQCKRRWPPAYAGATKVCAAFEGITSAGSTEGRSSWEPASAAMLFVTWRQKQRPQSAHDTQSVKAPTSTATPTSPSPLRRQGPSAFAIRFDSTSSRQSHRTHATEPRKQIESVLTTRPLKSAKAPSSTATPTHPSTLRRQGPSAFGYSLSLDQQQTQSPVVCPHGHGNPSNRTRQPSAYSVVHQPTPVE